MKLILRNSCKLVKNKLSSNKSGACEKAPSYEVFNLETSNLQKIFGRYFQKGNSMHRYKKYMRTKKGVSSRIYADQRKHSVSRGHPEPKYTGAELRVWLFSQPVFDALFQTWVDGGWNRWDKPSCDRLDASKPYSLDNLRVVSWRENDTRGRLAHMRPVIQRSKGGLENWFASIKEASRQSNVQRSNISLACKETYRTAGGFKWRYA